MMRWIVILFLVLKLALPGKSQVNALFVDDNSPDQESSQWVFEILEQYLGTMAFFNAVDSARSPEYEEMSPYNLVIWYCGIDEEKLYFWNGKFEDNPFLMEYLDKGGSLWLMGRDFLNTRFIKPPRNFVEGTFLHDYLGITRWISEAYTNDNGAGSRVLLEDASSPVQASLDSINWEDPPEILIDGCELVDGCYRTYYFGPGTYALYGDATAFYYPKGSFKNVTFTFDPALMDSRGNASTLLSDILQYYETVLDVEEHESLEKRLVVYPNPASDDLHIETNLSGEIEVILSDATGKIVLTGHLVQDGNSGTIHQLQLPGNLEGIYLLLLTNGQVSVSEKVLIAR
ncbi:MAG: T9SS type A sorting domain-containing protein [bacterium]